MKSAKSLTPPPMWDYLNRGTPVFSRFPVEALSEFGIKEFDSFMLKKTSDNDFRFMIKTTAEVHQIRFSSLLESIKYIKNLLEGMEESCIGDKVREAIQPYNIKMRPLHDKAAAGTITDDEKIVFRDTLKKRDRMVEMLHEKIKSGEQIILINEEMC